MVEVGEKAPNFSLSDTENRNRSLNEFLGQKTVLVFDAKAFLSNATKELCEFRDRLSHMINLNAQIVGVDTNAPSANKLLAEKYRLHFPILSDLKHEVTQAYGLDVPKRSIFVLEENGLVSYRWISKNSSDEPNFEEIEAILKKVAPKEQAANIPPTVITISRQIGSGGDEIAHEVARILGWSHFDKNLMVEVGRDLGVSEQDIVDFCEDTYRVQSLVDKLMLRRKPAKQSFTVKDNAHVRKTLDEEQCLGTIQTVINNLASRGKTVIVGRGGQAILKHKVGVLHVRVVAPKEVRLERIMKSEGLKQEDALKKIEENDKSTAEYLQRFYNIDLDNIAIYDMVLNTSKIDLGTAAKVIASIAKPSKL
jgi:peroxiredoxin/cytidylate kinase